MNRGRPPLALIAGPTASGKSALALSLARQRASVIVNADSAQVYADLRVVSARPNAAEEAEAPHALFGHVDGSQAYSAAEWARDATAALAQAWAAERLPILVGGTGLYLRTLLDGIAPVPEIDPAVRNTVRALPVAEAQAALVREDPAAAARLAPTDAARIARALEVVRSTGRTLKSWQSAREGGIAGDVALMPLILLPPREPLYELIDRRFEAMVEHGALEEVVALLDRNRSPTLPVMRAIGVPEIAAHLRGELDRDQMIARGQSASRRYAKRQYTWFRHQPPADWARVDRFLQEWPLGA